MAIAAESAPDAWVRARTPSSELAWLLAPVLSSSLVFEAAVAPSAAFACVEVRAWRVMFGDVVTVSFAQLAGLGEQGSERFSR